jgi:hypothetical protein
MNGEELQELLSRSSNTGSCSVTGKPIVESSHASFRTLSTSILANR